MIDIKETTSCLDKCRSMMHYYLNKQNATILDKAKAESLKLEVIRLKKELYKNRYEIEVSKFLEENPNLKYMFEEES